jgi:hypothetical protein
MRLTQPTHSALTLALSLCTLCLLVGAPHALAETSPAIDTGLPPTIYNSYWEGRIPSGEFVGVSIDVALPLTLSLYVGVDRADVALTFIDVRVVPAATPDATPIEGSLMYVQERELVLWTPTQLLDPSTAYTVDVFVNNEGLRGAGVTQQPDISGGFDITTSAAVITASPPILHAESSVKLFTSLGSVTCPPGEVVCRGDLPDDNLGHISRPDGCTDKISFVWMKPFVYTVWSDGEAEGEELFFTYFVTNHNRSLNLARIQGDRVLMSTHNASFHLELSELNSQNICTRIEAADLRSLAAGSVETLVTRHCISTADFPPLPDTETLLAACRPSPTSPDADGDDIAGSDIGADNLSSEDIEASACSCTTTRTSPNQAPAGLLLGLAVAFGAALSLRRRRD